MTMYDRDLIAGNMTGEPLGVLGAIDRGVFPGTDWRAVYEESLTAWLAEQRPKMAHGWDRLMVDQNQRPGGFDTPSVSAMYRRSPLED